MALIILGSTTYAEEINEDGRLVLDPALTWHAAPREMHEMVIYPSGTTHVPVDVSDLGRRIELEDGSLWEVADEDRHMTVGWMGQNLFIAANQDWFSPYFFRLHHETTGISVRCNMKYGPLYHNQYRHWITFINYYTQEITLENGTVWEVSGFDTSVFNTWNSYDTIIMGVNYGFFSSTKPNILINASKLSFVRVNIR